MTPLEQIIADRLRSDDHLTVEIRPSRDMFPPELVVRPVHPDHKDMYYVVCVWGEGLSHYAFDDLEGEFVEYADPDCLGRVLGRLYSRLLLRPPD